ncbi:hypothetical protein SAMN05192561_10173 [Halopenitus malekzadehii]|uniref:DUF8080 domain-containing protein n=1 Tax=Halopenitus malekzadehii TaxID=1267564 RepID=A0A1H6HS31_9EURY|nr:hypothetical protein [Halopenitus malekzadehii]SEH36783.1 hypothetical protein SAMN05192561_10173 [Halopenitus malekzadehii]
MDLRWNVERRGGLAIVTCLLCNDGPEAKLVRLRNDLDGPVVPPRRHGVPEPGWDRSGYTCHIEGSSRVGFGYVCATGLDSERRPMTIESVEPIKDEVGRRDTDGTGANAAADRAIRTLGDHRPPRDCVPGIEGPADRAGAAGTRRASADTNGEAVSTAEGGTAARADGSASTDGGTMTNEPVDESNVDDPDLGPNTDGVGSGRAPDGTAIGTVERRIETVSAELDRLTVVSDADLEAATSAVAEAGGLDALESDVDRIAAEIETLETLRDRLDEVIDRHDRLDVPITTLRRLA